MLLFRCPGEERHPTRGFLYDAKEFADVEQAKAEGWCETLEEAAGLTPPKAEETIAERLRALGVEVDKRWGEKRLEQELQKALEAQNAA